MDRSRLKRILPFLLIVIAFVGILWLLTLPYAETMKIIQEGGPVEDATAVVFWIGMALSLWRARNRGARRTFWLETAVLFCAMAVREGDPHRLFPGFDFMRGDFYSNGDIPLALRLFFGISLLGLFGTIMHWGLQALRLFIRAFKNKEIWVFTAMAFLTAEITACLHHKATAFLLRLFLPIHKFDIGFFVTTLEEPLELAGAILLVCVAAQIPPAKK